jgi:hypothetical protein
MARALELFARLARKHGSETLDKLDEEIEAAGYPQAWEPGSCLSYALRLSAKGMRREVRRVRGLAEGRLVRSETSGYRVTLPDGGRSNVVTKQQAIGGADPTETGKPRPGWGIARVTVRRIRRAP